MRQPGELQCTDWRPHRPRERHQQGGVVAGLQPVEQAGRAGRLSYSGKARPASLNWSSGVAKWSDQPGRRPAWAVTLARRRNLGALRLGKTLGRRAGMPADRRPGLESGAVSGASAVGFPADLDCVASETEDDRHGQAVGGGDSWPNCRAPGGHYMLRAWFSDGGKVMFCANSCVNDAPIFQNL